MRIFSYIVAIILIFLGITFSILNATPVALNYYVGTTHISLSLLLVLTLGAGILIGFVVSLPPLLRAKRKIYRLKNRVKQVEQELVTTKISENKELQ